MDQNSNIKIEILSKICQNLEKSRFTNKKPEKKSSKSTTMRMRRAAGIGQNIKTNFAEVLTHEAYC